MDFGRLTHSELIDMRAEAEKKAADFKDACDFFARNGQYSFISKMEAERKRHQGTVDTIDRELAYRAA